MKIFGNFFERKLSSFWHFVDSQMAIFRRVSFSSISTLHITPADLPKILVTPYWGKLSQISPSKNLLITYLKKSHIWPIRYQPGLSGLNMAPCGKCTLYQLTFPVARSCDLKSVVTAVTNVNN